MIIEVQDWGGSRKREKKAQKGRCLELQALLHLGQAVTRALSHYQNWAVYNKLKTGEIKKAFYCGGAIIMGTGW